MGRHNNGNASVGDGGTMVSVSAGHEFMGGTRDSDIVSCTDDVQEMSVVRAIRGVGGMCEMVYVFGSGQGGR